VNRFRKSSGIRSQVSGARFGPHPGRAGFRRGRKVGIPAGRVFRVTEFDADEGIPYNSFREIAPNLPPYRITPGRIGYLRRELLR